jgi:hypothetical protein
MEDYFQVQRRYFQMASHALWFEKCSNKFHDIDGIYIVDFHQLFCSGISGLYPHLQQELGRTLASYLTGPSHSAETQAIW